MGEKYFGWPNTFYFCGKKNSIERIISNLKVMNTDNVFDQKCLSVENSKQK